MRIVIPTHQRVLKQLTLANLPAVLRPEVLLVASTEDEAEQLRRHHCVKGSLKPKNVLVAPVNSIADKRQWILENVKSDVFMLDDDMDFYRRAPLQHRRFDGRWKPDPGVMGLSKSYAKPDELAQLFGALSRMLLDDVGAVGISSRFGNDLEEAEWRQGANRLMHAFGYRRKTLLKLGFQFNAVRFREDFHMALTLYRHGFVSYQAYDWCVAPGAYGAPGGCSDERTVAASDAAALELARIHLPFVKVVDKEYKGTPRKEVVVSWKRALAAGRGE